MIQSMTGFGKSVLQIPGKKITIEVKSLNSKNLDLNARIPGAYREKELEMRNRVAKSLQRGKIDLGLFIESTGTTGNTVINKDVVRKYMSELQDIADVGKEYLMETAMRLPDALKTEREEIDETEFAAIIEGLTTALREINNYRTDEGASLKREFELRTVNLTNLLEAVIAMDKERLADVKVRLEKAVADLKVDLDENRFEQELVYYCLLYTSPSPRD